MVVVLLPLLAIPAFILLGQSDFFLQHGASVWVRSNDAVFAMHDRDCQVVVFGDSTAMTGIDPQLVESGTGLKTCNIAVTNAVLSVTANLALDNYLAHNPKPAVMLVQLSPEGFQAENRAWKRTVYAEGMLELMRHGSAEERRRLLLTHPHEAVSFAGYAAGFSAYYGIRSVLARTVHLPLEEDRVHVRNGFFTPPAPARTQCEATPLTRVSATDAFPRAVVHGYQDGYALRTGTVLVNVAPIPSCDTNLSTYQRELDGVTSNTLLPLPINNFNDQRHYTATGSQIVSGLVADEVNQATGRDSYSLGTLATLRRSQRPQP